MFSPDFSAATGLLQHLNSEELNELLNDEEKLANMVSDLQQVKNLASEKEMLVASNKSLADYNLSLRPTLEHDRHILISQYESASALKDRVIDLRSRLLKRNDFGQSDVALALLQTATAQAEEATEELVEDLLNGKEPVDKFLETYLKQRAHMHVLRTKSDKMSALLNTGSSYIANNTSFPPEKPRRARKAPPPPVPKVMPTNQPPYPVLLNYGLPTPVVSPPKATAIVPSRIAPLPPVVIPQRHSNSPKAEAKSSSNQPINGHQRNSLPFSQNMPHPQYVQLPN